MARERFSRLLHDSLDLALWGLAWIVLPMALVGLGLAWVAHGLAGFTGDQVPSMLWQRMATGFGTSEAVVRLSIFVPLQVAVWVVVRKPVGRVHRALQSARDRWTPDLRLEARIPRIVLLVRLVFTTILVLILVPFVLQPTRVGVQMDRESWTLRVANLVDGTASRGILDSVMGVVHTYRGEPVTPTRSVAVDAGVDARMDRWDDLIAASTRSREHFAITKAFMYVESAGRQFAVSRTGCVGLMQFCVSTAQRRPFGEIFGRGQVRRCGCSGPSCAIPRAVQKALESDPEAIVRHRDVFPCDPSDARFDAPKAIRAGAAYTEELWDQFGGNPYLMYVGYNSGPAVSQRIWKKTRNPHLTLEGLRLHLAPTLERWYGTNATRRANGLLDVHLPKLKRAYDRYLNDAPDVP